MVTQALATQALSRTLALVVRLTGKYFSSRARRPAMATFLTMEQQPLALFPEGDSVIFLTIRAQATAFSAILVAPLFLTIPRQLATAPCSTTAEQSIQVERFSLMIPLVAQPGLRFSVPVTSTSACTMRPE